MKRARTGAPKTGASGSRPEAAGAEARELPPPVTPVRSGRPPAGRTGRARRGTALTFAGRRPPQDPDKLRAFLEAKDEFSRAYPKAAETPRRAKRVGTPTDAQYTYLRFIQMHMKAAKLKRPNPEQPSDQQEALKNAAQAWVASFEAGTPRQRRQAARVEAKTKKLAKKEAAAKAAKDRAEAAAAAKDAAKAAKKDAAQSTHQAAPKAGPSLSLRKKPAASARGRGGTGRGRGGQGGPARSSSSTPPDAPDVPEEEAAEDLEPNFDDPASSDAMDDHGEEAGRQDVQTSQPDDMPMDEGEPWMPEVTADDSQAEAYIGA